METRINIAVDGTSFIHTVDVYKRQIYKLSKEASRVLKEKYEFGTKYNIENNIKLKKYCYSN